EPKHVGAAAMQLCLEYHVILRFYELCDEVGLPLPPDEVDIFGHRHPMPTLNQVLGTCFDTTTLQQWKPTEVFALAQHLGVPTRLLDFSFNPKKALLFAVRDIVDEKVKAENFCIWAVQDTEMLNVALQDYRPDGLQQVQ